MNDPKSKVSILFFGKEKDTHCLKAVEFIKNNFEDVCVYLSRRNDPFPKNIDWEGDYIISYLSPWIIPDYILKRARITPINFHPASPEYPGIGCNNFALYEGADFYGVTCHVMKTHVDTGEIIATKRFPIFNTDTVETLLSRSYDFQLVLFYEVMELILAQKTLPKSKESWRRKPFTRKELNLLSKIDLSMDAIEIKKRIRATNFKEFRPYINIEGYTFTLDINEK